MAQGSIAKAKSKLEGPKIFLAALFFESFFTAEKKDSKNGADRKSFGHSYFVTTLAHFIEQRLVSKVVEVAKLPLYY